MNEYISREAAVEAVCCRCKYAFPEDEPCGDCPAKAAITAVPAADVEPVRQQWIPTSKALPPEDQTVLIYNDCDRHYYLGKIDSASKNGPVLFAERGGYPYHYGKYWMPIPSLPEE